MNKKIFIWNYHRLKAKDEHTEFDESVFDGNAEHFYKSLKLMGRYSDFITESDLIEGLKQPKKFPKRATLITFDDGYIDCLSVAAPILKSLGISGIFFIPTARVELGKLEWWDTLTYVAKKAGLGEEALPMSREWIKNYKSLDGNKAQEYLDQVLSQYRVTLPSTDKQKEQLLNWDQIRELIKMGMSVGSHTHSHRILSRLSKADQMDELKISKFILESVLGQKVKTIAYPVGDKSTFDAHTIMAAEQLGYELGFSFMTGVAGSKTTHPFEVSRLAPPRSLWKLKVWYTLPWLGLDYLNQRMHHSVGA